MSLDKLKLSKRLHASMNDLGFFSPKEFQLNALSRIVGGHSILGIAPDGAGKTTTYILGVLMRLKYTRDEAPKVLVLAPTEEKIDEIVERFYTISKNKNLFIMGLKASGNMEQEIEDLVRGVDIVVATPNRARAVYLKLGLNLNRIQTFIIDDAEEIIKQGMQTAVKELARSCGKVQYLAFSTVEHGKLHHMIDDFMPFATLVEVESLGEQTIETHELLLYQVPNFTTKINLLNLLLADEEVFNKVIIFVNTRLTAQKLAERTHAKQGEIAVFRPLFYDDFGIDDLDTFKHTADCRILIVANENSADMELDGIPFIFHFEIPEQPDVFVQHITKKSAKEAVAITFATDIELAEVKKIEQYLGKKTSLVELPDSIEIYQPPSSSKAIATEKDATDTAYHEKKESNRKSHNFSAGLKAKMNKKKR